jgi:hypothetical protein
MDLIEFHELSETAIKTIALSLIFLVPDLDGIDLGDLALRVIESRQGPVYLGLRLNPPSPPDI